MFSMEIEADLKLVLVEPSFSDKYLSIVSEQKNYLGEWLAWPNKADSKEFFLAFIKKSLTDYANGKSMICAILFNNDIVGNISFNTISHELKKVEIGYWLSSDFQGKGIVTKSVTKLIEYAFNILKMELVQISVATKNIPSRNVCERLGFSLSGTIDNSENLNGRIVAHAIYTMQAKQWKMI